MKMIKNSIASSFSRSSASYDQYARLQYESAQDLALELERSADLVEPGPILEVGCGSGRLSEVLVRTFQGRHIELLDIAPGMINQCRRKLEEGELNLENIRFRAMDAEDLHEKAKYSLVVSGLTIQWFDRPEQSLAALLDSLKPRGRFLFSFLADGSFAEWQEQCARLNIPCTVNPLPTPEKITTILKQSDIDVQSWQRQIQISYPSVRDFFLSLKRTGASTTLNGRVLAATELRRLIRQWQAACPGEVELTYNVIYLAGERL